MVPLACLDLWDLKVHKVQLVSQAPLECPVLGKLESPEPQAAEELLVLPEPQDKRESPAPLASLVTQVVLVPLAQLAHRVLEDSRVRQAHRDLKVTLVWLEPPVPGELRVSKELKDSLESPVFLVQLVLQEPQATMALRVLRVPRVMLVPQDSQVPMVLPDTKDTQVPQVLQENLEILEDQDLWAPLDQLDHLVLLDLKGTLDLLGLQDLLALQLKVFLVLRVHQVFQEPGVRMVSLDQLVPPALPAPQERSFTTMRRPCQSNPMRWLCPMR